MEFLCTGFLERIKGFAEMCNNPVLSIVLGQQNNKDSLDSQSINGVFDGSTAN